MKHHRCCFLLLLLLSQKTAGTFFPLSKTRVLLKTNKSRQKRIQEMFQTGVEECWSLLSSSSDTFYLHVYKTSWTGNAGQIITHVSAFHINTVMAGRTCLAHVQICFKKHIVERCACVCNQSMYLCTRRSRWWCTWSAESLTTPPFPRTRPSAPSAISSAPSERVRLQFFTLMLLWDTLLSNVVSKIRRNVHSFVWDVLLVCYFWVRRNAGCFLATLKSHPTLLWLDVRKLLFI